MATSTPVTDGERNWDQARWIKILDRIEHHQPDVGLKFWGPPLWLEVTMNGPDSDRSADTGPDQSWDWQSKEPCHAVTHLIEEGANDDTLLEAAGRYTLENLILNAVHEIGEWFRFDGQRLFPAHTSWSPTSDVGDDQGNGSVAIAVVFATGSEPAKDSAGACADDQQDARRLVARLTELGAGPRFTYLPGVTIDFDTIGPVITRNGDGEFERGWRSRWSQSTFDRSRAGPEVIIPWVARDVHRALIDHEVDRICRAFRLDRRQPWRLDAGGTESPLIKLPGHDAGADLLATSITYRCIPDRQGPSKRATGQAGMR
jgi:hypothetical protein